MKAHPATGLKRLSILAGFTSLANASDWVPIAPGQRLVYDKDSVVRRWEHEEILARLNVRDNDWMGFTHFLTCGLANVSAEMSLQVLAYNSASVEHPGYVQK